MNPLVSAFIARFLQLGLSFLGGKLVALGYFSGSEMEGYVTAAVAALLALGWSFWDAHKDLVLKNVALALPKGATMAQAKMVAKSDAAPPATVPEDRAPYIAGDKPANGYPGPDNPNPRGR